MSGISAFRTFSKIVTHSKHGLPLNLETSFASERKNNYYFSLTWVRTPKSLEN
jgi:hypothetical protein